MSWKKQTKKTKAFSLLDHVDQGSQLSTHTNCSDLTRDYGKLDCLIKPLWNRWSQHTHIYVDLCILSIARTQEEEFKPFCYSTRHSSISIIAQALDFPTVYINFQPVTELLTPAVEL